MNCATRALFVAAMLCSTCVGGLVEFDAYVAEHNRISSDEDLLTVDRESALQALYGETVVVVLKILDIASSQGGVRIELLFPNGKKEEDSRLLSLYSGVEFTGEVAENALTWGRWDRLIFHVIPDSRSGRLLLSEQVFVRRREYVGYEWPEGRFPKYGKSHKSWRKAYYREDAQERMEMLREFTESGEYWKGEATIVGKGDGQWDGPFLELRYDGWLEDLDSDGIVMKGVDPELHDALEVGDDVVIASYPRKSDYTDDFVVTVFIWSKD